jgi:glycine cleavage system H protein
MDIPSDRKYTETHEWIQVKDDVITIGLTEHAVDQLTDVTFVEMKSEGTSVDAGDSVGEVESVKTTSDVYSPVRGEIIEVNAAVADAPETLNSDPYGAGWLVRVKVADASGLDGLLDAAGYEASI